MLPELFVAKRLVIAAAVLAIAVGAAIALRPLTSGRARATAPPAATATRGSIVVTVGGVGRIVEERGAGPIAVPAATPVGPAAATATSAPTTASADSVFPAAAGRVARFLVTPGRHVSPGEAIAVLDDGNAGATALAQARNDAATARLELRQKETSDPAKGLPPTAAELQAARLALQSARERARLVAHPLPADTTAARLDVRKAESDLATLVRTSGPAAVTAARLAVAVAAARLAQASGPATTVDIAAAQAELAKAQADLDALRASPPSPSETALQAAQLAVTLAQQKVAELPPDATVSERTGAQLELKKAQADLEALQRVAPAPAASAVAAAQAAIDLAAKKLAQVTGPPSALTVASAQLDLRKAQAEIETLRRAAAPQAVAAARLAVALARRRLSQLLHPVAAARDTALSDAAKASADLQALLHRGAPAGPLDIAIARLKVAAADERVAAAERQDARLVVRSPFAGTVTALLTAPGAPADPTTPVATVADLRHLAVRVDLSEFDVAKVHTGEQAVLSIDALGGRKLPGRVTFVAFSGVDTGGVVTFPVRVSVAHPGAVRPGMNVSVRIVVSQRRGIVRVPLEAVHDKTVTLLRGDGRQQTRRVVVGLADNKLIEIKRGLRAGERVLLPAAGA